MNEIVPGEEAMKWSKAYKDRLPDSAFLVISPGGRKDVSGRTVPRSLRHLPVRDMNGVLSETHIRAALSRIGQPKTKLTEAQRRTARAKAEKLLRAVTSPGGYITSSGEWTSTAHERALKAGKARMRHYPRKAAPKSRKDCSKALRETADAAGRLRQLAGRRTLSKREVARSLKDVRRLIELDALLKRCGLKKKTRRR